MSSGRVTRTVFLLCLVALSSTSLVAAGNVAVLRIESVDAVLEDLRRLDEITSVPLDEEQILGMLSETTGISDHDWFDSGRPVVLALPLEGLMLGQAGVVTAFPVRDPEVGMAVLEELFGEGTDEGRGVLSFAREGQPSLYGRATGDYVILGTSPTTVAAADEREMTGPTDGPAGSVFFEVHVERLGPMILMGLGAARGTMEQRMTAGVEPDDGGGGNPSIDPAAASGIVDLYLSFVQDFVANTERFQMSIEMGANDLILHSRVVPRSGSTLAGFVAHQEGGLPELARLVEFDAEAVILTAGQVRPTPAILSAVESYARRYAEVIGLVADSLPEDAGPAAGLLDLWSGLFGDDPTAWTGCFRGDFASSFSVDAEQGMRMKQIVGITDADTCQAFIRRAASAMATLSAPDRGIEIHLTEDALIYGGVRAARQTVAFDPSRWTEEEIDPAEIEPLRAWFNEGMTAHYGSAGELMLVATGSESDRDFRALVDRVQAGTTARDGLTAETFAPIPVGPGYFVVYDVGRLFSSMGTMLGEDDAEATALGAFDSARVTYGMRLESAGVSVDVAIPLRFLGSLAAFDRAVEKQQVDDGASRGDLGG